MSDTFKKTKEKIEWTDEQTNVCIERYFDLLQLQASGNKINVAEEVRKLDEVVHHGEGSVRLLLQNISKEFQDRGVQILTALSPRTNSSSRTKALTNVFLDRILMTSDQSSEADDIQNLIDLTIIPKGNLVPRRVENNSKATFARDIAVVLYVRHQANGKCELCECEAPFRDSKGRPYLEVHHVKMLADNGPDIPENAVALCPNCHRSMHYSDRKHKLVDVIYSKIKRLTRCG